MRIRDKTTTAVCRTVEGIEWTSLKVNQEETELLTQESIPVEFSGETVEELMASIELPEEIAESIKGDISVPLRSSEMLMRVVELPATQADEIADMAALQIDKISPFPADQLAFSHEVLQQSEERSLVLLATAKRSCIDNLGDTFKEKGIHIHSIDSRALGWMHLLGDAGHIAKDGCDIIIIDDGIEFSLIIANDGVPLAFRMLHAPTADDGLDEIVEEIGYTLTTLDSEHDLKSPSTIQYWSKEALSACLRAQLSAKSGLRVLHRSLDELPPLSEGIVRRALNGHSRIELIPREWIEHEKNKQLRKKAIMASSVVVGVWLAALFIFFTVYKVRDLQLSSTKKRADAIAPAATQALENRQKLKALKVYTDRSDSALECLREVTKLLPPVGDIEFLKYSYDKGKAASIRGTAGNDELVDAFFIKLASSPLFEELKNQTSRPRTTKGVHRYEFSITLTLPSEENGK